MSDETLRAFAMRAATLPADARELFLRELEREGVSRWQLPLLPRSEYSLSPEPEPPAPLSFAQERLWFLQQLDPSSVEYNLSGAFQCTGALNVQALEGAFRHLFARHQILRTRIVAVDGRAEQRVEPSAVFPYPAIAGAVEDLTMLGAAVARSQLESMIQRERAQPFDLGVPPLLRIRVVKLGELEHVVLLTLHHIIADAWSLKTMLEDLGEGYRRHQELVGLRPPTEPASARTATGSGAIGSRRCRSVSARGLEPGLHYADFAFWQRLWLGGAALERDLAYWRRQLGGAAWRLRLPKDRDVRPGEAFNGRVVRRLLPPALALTVHSEARRQAVTPYMLLLSAFQLLLHRLTGQSEIRVGSSMADRPRPETEAMIGFFVNTLVLRTLFDDNPSVAELIGRVRKTVIDALEHGRAPFEKVVQSLRADTAGASSAEDSGLFQVLFVLQNAPSAVLSLPDVKLRALEIRERPARFELSLRANPVADGALQLSLEFDTRCYARPTAERWLVAYEILLDAMLRLPERRISELSWFPVEWSSAQRLLEPARPPSEPCGSILERFLGMAREYPERLALSTLEGNATYRDLARVVSRVAWRLGEQGVRRESRVLVCMPPGLPLIAALFGTLWARAVYVPLDSQWPRGRLLDIAADSGAQKLLTVPGELSEEVLQALRDRGISVCLFSELTGGGADATPEAETVSRRFGSAHPLELAYLMYTSGSRGRPKGVAVSHGSVLGYVAGVLPRLGLSAAARLLWLSSIGADLGYTSVWVALCSGRTLQCVSRATALDGDELSRVLKQQPADMLKVAPSQLRALLDSSAEPQHLLPRELLVLGGEAPPEALLQRVRALGPGCRIINHYGPTETTIGVTSHELELGSGSCEANVPLGREFAHVRADVWDHYGQPLPEGVPGELWLGGSGLARGYFGQPALTAERFVPSPFASEAGERRYRTGDEVIRRALDLEFLGRVDAQLNLNGNRIEPEEIAHRLRQHAAVSDARVLVEEVNGAQRLVAYLLCPESDRLDLVALRQRLEAELPAPMLPTRYRVVARWPLLGTGKLDLSRLPAVAVELFPPPRADHEDRSIESFPASERERQLAEIWRTVLQCKSVDLHDNFFALGGDSILSLQIVARARRAGIALTPRDVFDHPTVASLARAATDLAVAGSPSPAPIGGAQRLTPIQHWFFEQALPNPAHFNQSRLLPVPVGFDGARLAACLGSLALQHDVLRLRFQQRGGVWGAEYVDLETWLRETEPAFLDTCDLSTEPEERKVSRIEAGCAALQAGLDLGRPALVRMRYFDCGEHRSGRLFIVVHHLIVDAVSWRILLEDLDALLEGRQLGPKSTSYQSWADALTQYASSEALGAELGHWLSLPEPQVLPRDRAGQNLRATLATQTCQFSTQQTARLQALAAEAGVSLDAVLLAGIGRVLCDYCQSASVAIECEGHGRETIVPGLDLSRSVGWFTSRFPVHLSRPRRLGSGSGRDLRETLEVVQSELGVTPSKGVGYGVLRYLSGAASRLERPRPEISYNNLGQVDRGLTSGFWAKTADPVRESMGSQRDPSNPRSELIALQAFISGGRLTLTWFYSHAVHAPMTIVGLADGAFEALSELASEPLQARDPACVPEIHARPASADASMANIDDPIRQFRAES